MRRIIGSLIEIIKSEQFTKELQDLSLYCANIKQERQILMTMSKFIWKSKIKALIPCRLEVKKKDLWLNGNTLQAKFHYEFDILDKIEQDKTKNSFVEKTYRKELQRRIDSDSRYTFVRGLQVLNDFQLNHKPHIFLWIVSCRDYPQNYKKEVGKFLAEHHGSFSVYEKETRNCLDRNSDRNKRKSKVVEVAKRFLKDECSISSDRVIPVWRSVKNKYFDTDYLFIFCVL